MRILWHGGASCLHASCWKCILHCLTWDSFAPTLTGPERPDTSFELLSAALPGSEPTDMSVFRR